MSNCQCTFLYLTHERVICAYLNQFLEHSNPWVNVCNMYLMVLLHNNAVVTILYYCVTLLTDLCNVIQKNWNFKPVRYLFIYLLIYCLVQAVSRSFSRHFSALARKKLCILIMSDSQCKCRQWAQKRKLKCISPLLFWNFTFLYFQVISD